jgi:pimeloyl-ACP methyl ester carboxylesterase
MVIPSMPGYGFSGRPSTTGWDPVHIARAWTVLMKRLGYTGFVAQGGDWGAIITELMGAQPPPELLGIHTNMANVIPPDIDKAAFSGAPAPAGLSADEKLAYERVSFVYAKGIGYGFQLGLRPVPVAVSVFPDELYPAPRSWAERAYPKLIHYNKLDKGGHFAAWEQPSLFVDEVRAGFRSLRT